MLIRAGAPPGFVKQPNGTTPLHMAAQMNNVSVIRLLLREGAPVDALNRSWCTPLMTAAAHAHASAAAVLVSAGASTYVQLEVFLALYRRFKFGLQYHCNLAEDEEQA